MILPPNDRVVLLCIEGFGVVRQTVAGYALAGRWYQLKQDAEPREVHADLVRAWAPLPTFGGW